MSHIRPLHIGTLQLASNVLYAPLAGCSDFPFRQMTTKYGPALVFCEMVKMDALIRKHEVTLQMLDYSKDMHPIGAQLCGSKPEIAAESASIIEGLGFDVIDLNCGCPVDKVTKDGSGSGLLKDVNKIGDILSNIVQAVKIPVTLKIRAGWDEDAIVVQEVTRIAEQAGAKAITVHGRTREQGYTGAANWEWVRLAKEAASSIKVIGNGDIFLPADALRCFEVTGCDGVLVARGTFGQPWIVRDICALDAGQVIEERSLVEKKKALQEHLEAMLAYYPERKVVLEMRRVGCWYFTKAAGARQFRLALTQAESVAAIKELIEAF